MDETTNFSKYIIEFRQYFHEICLEPNILDKKFDNKDFSEEFRQQFVEKCLVIMDITTEEFIKRIKQLNSAIDLPTPDDPCTQYLFGYLMAITKTQ